MKLRLFFGIPFPGAVASQEMAMKAVESKVRWTSKNNLHITLLFLGSVDEEHLASLIKAGDIRCRSFNLTTEKLSVKNKHMVWLELNGSEEANALHEKLEENVSAMISFKKEERKFRPHVTLARSREKIKTSGFPPLEQQSWNIDSYILYNSVQGKEGTEYIPLKTYKLETV